MVRRPVLFVLALLTSAPAMAQVIWQPTPAPLVTAQNESWYLAGEPIEWAGEVYYPAGTPRYFDAYQMTSAGSYRGIPLYSDARGPSDAVFLPIGGDRLQPYRPARTPPLAAGTAAIPAEVPISGATESGAIAEPTDQGAMFSAAAEDDSAPIAVIGTTGRTAARPDRIESVNPPSGLNGIWVNYEGARWFLAGRSVDFNLATFTKVGTYYGFSVYQRGDDPSTIYIPVTSGRMALYRRR